MQFIKPKTEHGEEILSIFLVRRSSARIWCECSSCGILCGFSVPSDSLLGSAVMASCVVFGVLPPET